MLSMDMFVAGISSWKSSVCKTAKCIWTPVSIAVVFSGTVCNGCVTLERACSRVARGAIGCPAVKWLVMKVCVVLMHLWDTSARERIL